MEVAEAAALIESGRALSVAGDQALLEQLPAGTWIGGTIPYFMGDEGGEFTQSKLFVTDLGEGAQASLQRYDAETIAQVYLDAPENGFSVIIVPAFTPVHEAFAKQAPTFEGFASQPLIGWISGCALEDIGQVTPKAFAGSGEALEQEAVVLRCQLPPERVAEIKIVNIHAQGDGPVIRFDAVSFAHEEVEIDGERRNLAAYVEESGVDTKMPLVASYFGAMINTSFMKLEEGKTEFYAPVFPGVDYRVAKPVPDYVAAFEAAMPEDTGQSVTLCNCILNYVYGGLEGKLTGAARGPMTFGEIAYQLLNQTMAYLVIHEV